MSFYRIRSHQRMLRIFANTQQKKKKYDQQFLITKYKQNCNTHLLCGETCHPANRRQQSTKEDTTKYATIQAIVEQYKEKKMHTIFCGIAQ